MKRISRWCMAGLLACTALSARPEADLVYGISLADPTLDRLDRAGVDSWVADVSADGRYVVFVSRAPNLVEGQAVGGFVDVYVRDRIEHTTLLASVNRQGTGGGNGHSNAPRISADGRFVYFLPAGENERYYQVKLK